MLIGPITPRRDARVRNELTPVEKKTKPEENADAEKRAVDIACRNSLKMDLQKHREKMLLKAAEAKRSVKKCRKNLIR
ncbi:hypothetical protein OESDEN_14312 [Oesophagostomum dentatum]|uniref:Uncharacterized protein n=1 Tax=Oesophagostomum dentatum TaxID=61180 RepID=A0A0B1SRU8_OESDE|nr:hypothetical protein OESDEN_14312 [Oesophagostomum dentatum]